MSSKPCLVTLPCQILPDTICCTLFRYTWISCDAIFTLRRTNLIAKHKGCNVRMDAHVCLQLEAFCLQLRVLAYNSLLGGATFGLEREFLCSPSVFIGLVCLQVKLVADNGNDGPQAQKLTSKQRSSNCKPKNFLNGLRAKTLNWKQTM